MNFTQLKNRLIESLEQGYRRGVQAELRQKDLDALKEVIRVELEATVLIIKECGRAAGATEPARERSE